MGVAYSTVSLKVVVKSRLNVTLKSPSFTKLKKVKLNFIKKLQNTPLGGVCMSRADPTYLDRFSLNNTIDSEFQQIDAYSIHRI